MANELRHGSVGTELTQAEWEGVGTHVLNSQASGDIIYASASDQLSRLAKATDGNLLELASGLPAWTSSPTIGSTSWGNANHAHAASNSGGTVAGSALSGSSLASGITSSSLTSVGTIATGVWQGTDVGVAYGGTGVSTLTDGGVLLGSGTSAVTAMAVLTDGQMIVGDGSTDPVAESGATLRTSIGVGTGDSVQFAGITGTTIDATTDFTIGDTVITDGVITDSAGIQIVGTGYPLHTHRAASSAQYLAFTNTATGTTLGTDSFDIGLAGSGYALIRHRKEEKIAIGTDGTNRLVINAAGGMSEVAISGTAGVVRASIYKTGIADNSATNIFTITSTNESGDADDGAYTAIMSGVIGHRIDTDTGAHAMKAFQYAFGRTIRGDGTGVNTAVTEIYESAVAASASGTRSIGTVTMTVTETSEYVQTVAIQIDLTGSSVSTAEFMVNVELNWAEFATEPVIAAS